MGLAGLLPSARCNALFGYKPQAKQYDQKLTGQGVERLAHRCHLV